MLGQKYDESTVRRFTNELSSRRTSCHEEGTFCSTLDEEIACQLSVCQELLAYVREWAASVHSGDVEFDPTVEELFHKEIQSTIGVARPLVQSGVELRTTCFDFARLDSLQKIVNEFEQLLNRWVTPQKAVGPARRVELSQAAIQEGQEKVMSLPVLPLGWRKQ